MESQVPETQAMMESQVPETQQPLDAVPATEASDQQQEQAQEESQVGETQVDEPPPPATKPTAEGANEQEEKEVQQGEQEQPKRGQQAQQGGDEGKKQEEKEEEEEEERQQQQQQQQEEEEGGEEGNSESQIEESQVPETMAMDVDPEPQQAVTSVASGDAEETSNAGQDGAKPDNKEGTAADEEEKGEQDDQPSAQEATRETQPAESQVPETQPTDITDEEQHQHQQQKEDADDEKRGDKTELKATAAANADADAGAGEPQGDADQEATAQTPQQDRQQREHEQRQEEGAAANTNQPGSETVESSQAEAGTQDETEDVLNAIFGDSDEEDDEEGGTFEGFDMPAALPSPPPPPEPKRKAPSKQRKPRGGKRKAKQQQEGVDEQDNERPSTSLPDPFARKKPKRRKNTGIDTNVDEKAVAVLKEMKNAAEADAKAVERSQPAFKKLSLLPKVVTAISKPQLQPILMDNGLCSHLAEWLQPYANQTLPNVNVRSKLLRVIASMRLGPDDGHNIRVSRLDETCELLRRDPRESPENKRRLAVIKDKFNRVLCSGDGFVPQATPEMEEAKRRRQLQQRRLQSLSSSSSSPRRATDDKAHLRPGEKGFILRARVPQPEDREYIARPESKVNRDFEATARAARSQGRLAEFQRMFKSQKNKSKSRNMAAFQVNITGSFSAGSK